MTKSNSLCSSYVENTSNKSYFKAFEIVTMRELPCDNGGTLIKPIRTVEEFIETNNEYLDDTFYRVFGIFKDDHFIDEKRKAIGDFYNPVDACIFLEELTGNKAYIYSY